MIKFNRKLNYDTMDIAEHVIQQDTVFVDMLTEFRKLKFNDECKLIYAHLNTDPFAMIQFVLIGKITIVAPPKAMDQRTRRKYLVISAPNYSLASLQSYHMAKRDGLIDDYFIELLAQPTTIPEPAFNDFITYEAELSLDKNSDKFWKLEQNADKLAEQIVRVNAIAHSRT